MEYWTTNHISRLIIHFEQQIFYLRRDDPLFYFWCLRIPTEQLWNYKSRILKLQRSASYSYSSYHGLRLVLMHYAFIERKQINGPDIIQNNWTSVNEGFGCIILIITTIPFTLIITLILTRIITLVSSPTPPSLSPSSSSSHLSHSRHHRLKQSLVDDEAYPVGEVGVEYFPLDPLGRSCQ